jgi:hypothetical protein
VYDPAGTIASTKIGSSGYSIESSRRSSGPFVYFVHPHSVDFKGRVGEASVPLRPRREADRSDGGALTIRLRAPPVDATFQDAFKRSVFSLFQQVHDDAAPTARG